jgi:pimeloyl-ACP methyl ester carboxylesterase
MKQNLRAQKAIGKSSGRTRASNSSVSESLRIHNALPNPSLEKKFRETVLFIHHFGGNRSTTRRQQELVKELGFDAVSFDLELNASPAWRGAIIEGWRALRRVQMGTDLKATWAKQISEMCDLIPGDKIIFSLSSPSAAALKVIAEREKKDIKAWVCDGGPFLLLYSSFIRFYALKTNFPGWARPFASAMAFRLFGGFEYNKQMKQWIENFPLSLPILSVRAGEDKLVPPASIKEVFDPNPKLDLTVLNIPLAEHLEGLKKFPELYKKIVGDFLLKVATKL